MYFHIDPSSGTPLYLQVIAQIKHAISLGIFQPGQSLPTIREIATDLQINPNTVAKAIRELEREGFVNTRVGKGTFVTERSSIVIKQEQFEKAQQLIQQFVQDMQWLGFSKEKTWQEMERIWHDAVDD